MTELAIVQNTGSAPVPLSEGPDARLLGVGEYGPAAHRTDHVRSLIRSGSLGLVSAAPTADSQIDGEYGAVARDLDRAREEQAAAEKADRAQARKGATTTAQEG